MPHSDTHLFWFPIHSILIILDLFEHKISSDSSRSVHVWCRELPNIPKPEFHLRFHRWRCLICLCISNSYNINVHRCIWNFKDWIFNPKFHALLKRNSYHTHVLNSENNTNHGQDSLRRNCGPGHVKSCIDVPNVRIDTKKYIGEIFGHHFSCAVIVLYICSSESFREGLRSVLNFLDKQDSYL
jgi:hypothetical protein